MRNLNPLPVRENGVHSMGVDQWQVSPTQGKGEDQNMGQVSAEKFAHPRVSDQPISTDEISVVSKL